MFYRGSGRGPVASGTIDLSAEQFGVVLQLCAVRPHSRSEGERPTVVGRQRFSQRIHVSGR